MKLIRILVSLAIAAALAGPALAQRNPKPAASGKVTYKCLDSRGKLYYSDKLSPECSHVEEMNPQGRVVKKHETVTPATTPDSAANKDSARKDTAERQRRDRALMSSYTSEAEIDLARDRSLVIPLQAIKTAESRQTKANEKLFDLKTQATRLAEQKKAIPPHLLEEIDAKQQEVSALEAEVQQKKNYAESVHVRYQADKLRFRELTTAGR